VVGERVSERECVSKRVSERVRVREKESERERECVCMMYEMS
jgi:hypothetical protein